MKKYFLIIFILQTVLCNTMQAQYSLDAINQIGLKKGVTINGSFNLSSVAYTALGITARRDPFDWFATASLNVNLFGIAAPLSFSYSNARISYSQPFNRIKIIPQYKWAKLHLGTGYMNFNDYTLAGHVFSGYGIELTPKKYKFMAMAGSLQSAVPHNIQNPTAMAYKRNAIGFLAGIDKGRWAVELSALHAKDDVNSIPFIPASAQVFPQSNLATALKVKSQVTRWLYLDATYAMSALTADNRDSVSAKGNVTKPGGQYALLSLFFPKNTTTSYYDAIDFAAGFMLKKINLQLKYQRVAPGYASLGAYYTNNDMENITIAPAFSLLGGKINIAANAGVQRNNLDQSKNATNKRLVASGNIAINLNQHWSFNTAFSNFTMHTRVRPQSDPFYVNGLDSLNFYQINKTFTQMVMYNFGNKNNKQTILLTVSYQQAQDQTNTTGSTVNNNSFFTSNIGYTYNKAPRAFTASAAINYYANNVQGIQTDFIGPTLGITKAFMDKQLPVNMGITYNTTTINGQNTGNVLNGRIGATYSLSAAASQKNQSKTKSKAKHSFNCNVQYTGRSANATNPAFSEWTMNTGYVMSF